MKKVDNQWLGGEILRSRTWKLFLDKINENHFILKS